MIRSWFQSHSIKTHVILFIMMLAVLLSVVNWLAYEKMAAVRMKIQEQHVLAAKAELAKALLSVQPFMTNATQLFVDSDETHQQLYDASFYEYWRDGRALNSGLLPAAVDAIALYDRHGKVLAPAASGDIPSALKNLPALWISQHDGKAYGYLVRPLYDGYSNTQRSGYALIRFDFMAALREVLPFYDVNTRGFGFDLVPNQVVMMSKMIDHIHFRPSDNPDVDMLFKVMQQTQFGVLWILLFLSLGVYLLVMRFMATPLVNLARHIHILGGHHSREDAPQFEQPLYVLELDELRCSLNTYQQQLDGMHRRIDDKNKALWEMAHRDGLTGAYNRLAYDEELTALHELAKSQFISATLLLIDCDKFKYINDSYGHQVGDEILVVLVKLIQKCLRTNDKLYRIGGDEFVVLLTENNAMYGVAVGQRILQAVAEFETHQLGMSELLSVSVGIAHAATVNSDVLMSLHKQADKAMYRAKQQTSQKLVVYEPNMA
ncbi:MAG: GGDEF domain-containing protein [Sulfuriferula sp.]